MRKKVLRGVRKFKLGISKLKFIVAYKYGTSGILIWMANFGKTFVINKYLSSNFGSVRSYFPGTFLFSALTFYSKFFLKKKYVILFKCYMTF